MKTIFRIKYTIIAGFILLLINSCTIRYTFTGASIDPSVKTISVLFFPNRAEIVNPTLSQEFTDELIDRMKSQTNLEFIEGFADVTFEGEIRGYKVSPTAIQSDGAALNRFTITVRVKFTNEKQPELSFDSSFSHYVEFDANDNFSDIEADLVEEIIEKLTEDIFNKAFSNW